MVESETLRETTLYSVNESLSEKAALFQSGGRKEHSQYDICYGN